MIAISDVQVIDADTIGFGKCAIVTGNYGCGMYTLDLDTNTLSERYALQSYKMLMLSGWYDVDTYAYLYDDSSA